MNAQLLVSSTIAINAASSRKEIQERFDRELDSLATKVKDPAFV